MLKYSKFIDEGQGKTIIKIVRMNNGSGIYLAFTDSTYSVLRASQGWDASSDLYLIDAEFDPFNDDGEQAVEAGICTEEERNELHEKARRSMEARNEANERRQYERLKAKYEKEGKS